MLDRDWIAARIPHQGRMCLLDAVLAWTDSTIHCRASGHSAPDHPLRDAGRLGVAVGIEYAAQAMAVHGALLAGDQPGPRQGYLTSVRGVRLHTDRLDHLLEPLDITAERQSGDNRLILYRFAVYHAGTPVLDGRATVVLDADTL